MAKHQMKFVLLPHRRDGLAVPRNWHNLWKVQNIVTFSAKTAFSNLFCLVSGGGKNSARKNIGSPELQA